MKNIISEVRKELIAVSDQKTKDSFQRFFKEKVKFHGVTMPRTRKIAKEKFAEIKNLSKKEIFALCAELLASGYCEEAIVAANWVYWCREKYEISDIDIFEDWIEKYIDNWAECDTFCNHAIGAFIEMYSQKIEKLKIWVKSKNLWMRRAAAVSLILPARHGKFLSDIFQISDILLTDKEDLVQKGYGWMLKAASQSHQKEVYDYVMKNKKVMPRTALRYAIEKMPPEMKKSAMEK